jgi:hypothetical protein
MENIKQYYITRNEENIVWERIEDEVFVILTKENEEKVFKLNKTAGFLWENCDGKKTVQELLEELCLKYDVDETKAFNDIIKFIDQMKDLQLLALSKSSA